MASFAGSPAFNAVLVVGDLKSPEHYALPGVRFIPVAEQRTLPWKSLAQLPFNHYCRKMIGYLEAVQAGCDIVFDTDDDNCLIVGTQGNIWTQSCASEVTAQIADEPYVNVYRHFTDQAIWPRGFPLDLIGKGTTQALGIRPRADAAPIGIWQGLANGDPDVDAIYRLVSNTACTFNDAPAVALPPGLCCPFNSQNTAFARDLLPLMYLPAFVSFRYTDILRGLVAQPVLWAAGSRLAFTAASVFQDRNVHDYMKDFQSEVSMYLTGRQAFAIAVDTARADRSVADNLRAIYAQLETHQIVEARELALLDLWLDDCAKASALPH